MKRKRGNKKGKKAKAPSASTPTEAPSVGGSGNSDANSGNDEYESGMEVDTPSSAGPDHPSKPVNVDPNGSGDKAAGKPGGRVKVKLKTSKALDSDAPSHSDTDKSSQQVDSERRVVSEKMEDSGNSSVEVRTDTSNGGSKKAGSIIIKSSRTLSGSSIDMGGGAPAHGETTKHKEPKTPQQNYRYNKQELESSLTVIKKVMKMEAAAPFNEPVNPEALGIPDYFDIIDTPMDFGTICTSLEKCDKYMNSKDVYKDVQFIWDNCSKYNNKGDAILDLMRRVKKNFMKYWTAAGLYTEQSKVGGSNEADDSAVSSQGKTQMKVSQSKMKKGKHGRRHKSDCLCAICVLKRRKREREANERLARGQIGLQDQKQEELSPADSPFGEDSSLNMDEMADLDAEGEVEDTGVDVKPEVTEQQHGVMDGHHGEEEDQEENEEESEVKILGKIDSETRVTDKPKVESQIGDRVEEEPKRGSQSQPEILETLVDAPHQKPSTQAQQAEERKRVEQQRRKEIEERKQKAMFHGRFNFENPTLLNVCGTLFPEDPKSVWCGPHSLLRRKTSSTTSSIHAAIEALME